ncbi:MAG: HigA family addiction module antitoxin [Dehalococcoidia bacterium]
MTITDSGGEELASELPPLHPGEMLLEEFLKPLGMSQYRLAQELKISPRRVHEIVLGRRGITGDTALRLARFFGVSAEFWMGLQTQYDLDLAIDRAGEEIARTVRRLEYDESRAVADD